MDKPLVISTMPVDGVYDLYVITDTEAEGRKAFITLLEAEGSELRYYETHKEFVDDTMQQHTLLKGEVVQV